VFDAGLLVIGVAMQTSIASVEVLKAHRVTTVAVCSNWQAAITWTAHLNSAPEQQLGSAINEHARALRAHSINVAINRVAGHFGIPGDGRAHH